VEASFGLGEALVSGLASPDVYKVRGGEIVSKTVAAKRLAIHPIQDSPSGGYGNRRSSRSGRTSLRWRMRRSCGSPS